MQTLTRRLDSASRVSGVEGYKNVQVRDLACTSSPEPLNGTVARKGSLSLPCNVEGHSTLTGEPVIGRIPVVSADATPLMPCKPSKARKLLQRGLAEKRWSKLEQFYLRLRFEPKSELNANQQVCLAVDPGSKWDGIAVVSEKGVLTSGMLVLPSKVAERLEQRRVMRRGRRHRKTPRRAKRFDNRRQRGEWIAPSQKAKVDFRTKIVDELCRLYPVNRFTVEDVRFNHYKKRWGKHFSTVEIGKTRFYRHLRMLGELTLHTGVETAELRERFGLPKNPVKRELSWTTHAVDAIALGSAEIGCVNPYPPEFRVWKRFEYAKRQLHRLEPDKGGHRRRYGGSWSIPPFRKGDVVLWCGRRARVGGFMDGHGISLHSFGWRNRRFTQNAKPNECTRLFNQHVFSKQEQPQFLPPINGVRFLGGF
jgi:hypothetical protein